MQINNAIREAMKVRKVTQERLGKMTGDSGGQRGVQKKLSRTNLQTDTVLEMLDALDFELIVQPKRPGKRQSGQIVISRLPDEVQS